MLSKMNELENGLISIYKNTSQKLYKYDSM